MALFVVATLVVVLGVTRLMKLTVTEDEFVLQKLESVSLAAPPEPSYEEPEEMEEVDALPPPPVALELAPVIELESLALPQVEVAVPKDLKVDLFALDEAPAELLTEVVKPKLVVKKKVNIKLPKRRLNPNSLDFGDLDSKPRNLRVGSFRWPSGVRENVVLATLKIEVDQQGKVRLLSIDSLSNSRLRREIPRLIRGARFTKPLYQGQPVKATYTWKLELKKP